MRLELILLIIAGFIMANIYTEGKYTKVLLSWKKYYQMAGVAFAAFMLYILLKKNPLRAREIVSASNDYIKYLPIDKNTSNIISPILDFTSKQQFANNNTESEQYNYPIVSMNQQHAETRILHSGKKTTKRSVKCGNCKNKLSAWFEVDHKTRLEHGGSNHVDNLVALCRECHGEKTAMENL